MEEELKFQIIEQNAITDFQSEQYWDRLGYQMLEPDFITMKAVYFDTADRDFAAIKGSIRIRQENDLTVLTVKAALKRDDLAAGDMPALFQRQEWEWPLDLNAYQGDGLVATRDLLATHRDEFPVEIRDLLTEHITLEEVYQASFRRFRATLRTSDAAVELAVDQGALIGLYERAPISELELELKEGHRQVLKHLSNEMMADPRLGLQALSKAARLQKLSTYDFTIIGGGAAGLMAAITYQNQKSQDRILLLDGEEKLGRKLTASGNGRGNLTNIGTNAGHYHSVSGTSGELVQKQLERCPPEKLREVFLELGLHTRVEEDRVYPFSFQAKSVVDVMEHTIHRHPQTHIRLKSKVTDITALATGFRIRTEHNESFYSEKILVACGGEASPKLGSDGSLFSILEKLGHRSTQRYPGLVQLVGKGLPKRMVGQRVQGECLLWSKGSCLGREYGEILITDYGLSGIPILNLSHAAAQAFSEHADVEARINLLADLDPEAQLSFMDERCQRWPEASVEAFGLGLLSEKIAGGICSLADIDPQMTLGELNAAERARIRDLCLALPIKLKETKGFTFAQVCCGGLETTAFDNERLESKMHPGLYVAGEVLDVHGDCGGYNLNFAFISGMHAAIAAAE